MGPNGAGKSTLANVLMGHPSYEVTQGEVIFKGENILGMPSDERSRKGLFLAFQYPVAIPGVSVANFLRMAVNARRTAENGNGKAIPLPEFRELLKAKMDLLKIPHEFAGRHLNDGFSGGEKKRAEILQLATLEPAIAILDETDSGLDIDAVRNRGEGDQRTYRGRAWYPHHHSLSTHPELHQTRFRTHFARRPDSTIRRPRAC